MPESPILRLEMSAVKHLLFGTEMLKLSIKRFSGAG